MPKRLPVPRSTREAVADEIRAGRGRNELARAYGISPGSVTNIAREFHVYFSNDWRTREASEARRIDAELARLEKEQQLLDELLRLPTTTRRRDGRETKAYRRISYALYNLRRHHG